MVIAFDLDNTVFTQGSPELNYIDSEPILEMVTLVNKLYDDGHKIFIFTARHFKHFVYTDNSLKSAGLKFHGLVMNKISCDLYVDDKGFRMNNNPNELLELIKELS